MGQHRDAALDFNTASAFSGAELDSFQKLFGDRIDPFANSRALLSRKNAPWNNLLTRDAAEKLTRLLGRM
jgi:hypothetical protein